MPPDIRARTFPDGPDRLPESLHPLLRRILRSRGLTDPTELDLGLRGLLPPDGLSGLGEAVDLLAEAVTEGRSILIVGDFDADGATSCALAVLALRALGAERVDYLVPDRFAFGYGLSPALVDLAAMGSPHLIVTVDNGISSHAGVRRAQELGIRVLVTDHHLPAATLPPADAILNPNRPEDGFASKHLAGVGVVFYLLSALRRRLREAGWLARRGIPEPNLADYLDLVALGTVADLVPLDRNNRILVHQGLLRIRAGRCRPGIRALLKVGGRALERVTTADLGFAAGPRLNAAGRLEDMSVGIDCLLAEDETAALAMAQRLDGLNRERRDIEGEMKAQAEALMTGVELDAEGLPFGLCLYDERWHQGVIGILAARIKDRYHRPVIACAPAGDGELKGSARSIPGLHLRDVLANLDSADPGLIGRFGGHAMAAGLSLQAADLGRFARAFDAEVARQLGHRPPRREWLTDGTLDPADLAEEIARLLRYAAPWGQGFPEPLFEGRFTVQSARPVGGVHLRLGLVPDDGPAPVDAVLFNWGDGEPPRGRVRVLYRLDLNVWQGVERAQLVLEYLEPDGPGH